MSNFKQIVEDVNSYIQKMKITKTRECEYDLENETLNIYFRYKNIKYRFNLEKIGNHANFYLFIYSVKKHEYIYFKNKLVKNIFSTNLVEKNIYNFIEEKSKTVDNRFFSSSIKTVCLYLDGESLKLLKKAMPRIIKGNSFWFSLYVLKYKNVGKKLYLF